MLIAGAAGTVLVAAIAPDMVPFHERKEVAGLAIVFGAEPEPALTEEMQFLRWRVSSLESEEAYTELSGEVVISFAGEEQATFPVRAMRGAPGSYQTRHIFTEPGEYETVLSFQKGDVEEVHTVDFNFTIRDRSTLELPRGDRGLGIEDAQTDEVAAVRAVIEAVATGMEAGDFSALDMLFVSDRGLHIIEGAGVNHGWADYRDNHLRPELESFRNFSYQWHSIEPKVNGDTAFAAFRYDLAAETDRGAIEMEGRGTIVLEKRDGRWMVVHLHTSGRRAN